MGNDWTNVNLSAGLNDGSDLPSGITRATLNRIYNRLKEAERPRVSFQDDQGAMFLEAFRLREKIIKEVLQELEPYV